MIDFLIILALIWLTFAVVQDFRQREIANWLNFSLIIFALAARLFYSIFTNNFNYFFFGLYGLLVFFILGNLFYYMRLFAGGDAKLLIALGTILPFANNFYENTLIFFVFTIGLLFAGAIYTLCYSFGLVLINRQRFVKEFRKQANKIKTTIIVLLISAVAIVIISILLNNIILSLIALLIFVTPFLYLYTKSVEQSYMMVYTSPTKVTIGDWIAETIHVGNVKIEPYWEGLNEEQVELIKKHYKKKILIKQGVPFSPSFLISFLIVITIKYFYNSNWGFF
ncbi:MAG: A24 family peptidase [Candidatus Pacearchaeota archaeon]|jgi:Flp pilus assembly protein protease CpaA